MLDFIYGFALINKLKRYELVSVMLQIVINGLITYKVANSFGYYFDSKFNLSVEYFVNYIFSGHFIAMLFFIGITFIVLNHASLFIPYLLSTIWNDKVYSLENHLSDMKEFDVLSQTETGFNKGKHFDLYEAFLIDVDENRGFLSALRHIQSLIVALIFLLISYDVLSIWLDMLLIVVGLYFMVNATFVLVKYRQINYHRHTISKMLANEPNPDQRNISN